MVKGGKNKMTLYSEKAIKDYFSKSLLAKYRYYKRKKYRNKAAFSRAIEAEIRAWRRKGSQKMRIFK